jgi:hypothetical protein
VLSLVISPGCLALLSFGVQSASVIFGERIQGATLPLQIDPSRALLPFLLILPYHTMGRPPMLLSVVDMPANKVKMWRKANI